MNYNKEIEKQEKRAFYLDQFYTDDVIFMLNMLDIPWLMCPPGFEAEQICAISTYNPDILGITMDYVLTPDADALLFGAEKVIKRDIRKKKLFEYELNKLLIDNSISQQELIKIGLILGTDLAPKTKGIGIKTVLKKHKTVELSPEQLEAKKIFEKELTPYEINNLIINNFENSKNNSFIDQKKYEELLDWLELVKCYNRKRIDKIFMKNQLFYTD